MAGRDLKWATPKNILELSGTEVVSGLAPGNSTVITVTHQPTAFAGAVSIQAVSGVHFHPLADGTTDSQFSIEVENISHDDGYGGAADITVNWTRKALRLLT